MKLRIGETAVVALIGAVAYATGYFFGYNRGEERGAANAHMLWIEALCEVKNAELDDLMKREGAH